MITITSGCYKPMPCSLDRIGSLTFNGCGFALIHPYQSGVILLDEGLCAVKTVPTAHRYNSLCYDRQCRCYWASTDCEPSVLFRLDLCFCEVARLKLTGCCRQKLCGLSCDPYCNTLLLIYPEALAYVDKTTGVCCDLPRPRCAQPAPGILSLCGGLLYATTEEGVRCIIAESPGYGTPARFCIPMEYQLEAILLRGVCQNLHPGCVTYEVSLLLTKRCNHETVMLQLFVTLCKGHMPPCPPVPPCPPTPPYPPYPPVPPCPPYPPYPPIPPYPPCPPHPPIPPFPPFPPLPCGKNAIMHSVALEEAGIAHILNAEGEKLQKAVAESASVQELLCVNESVRKTVAQITLLEGQLYAKLESLSGLCDDNPCLPMQE